MKRKISIIEPNTRLERTYSMFLFTIFFKSILYLPVKTLNNVFSVFFVLLETIVTASRKEIL